MTVPDVPQLQKNSYNPSSCISYIRSRRSDLTEPWGTPKNFAQTHTLHTEPWVGKVVILKEGPVWHVALVESIEGDTMTVSESNYIAGKYGTRTLPLNYALIVGYW